MMESTKTVGAMRNSRTLYIQIHDFGFLKNSLVLNPTDESGYESFPIASKHNKFHRPHCSCDGGGAEKIDRDIGSIELRFCPIIGKKEVLRGVFARHQLSCCAPRALVGVLRSSYFSCLFPISE